MKRRLLALRAIGCTTIVAVAGGCATGPTFTSPELAPAGRAQLYIYRPMVLAGGGTVHKVIIDGKAAALSLPNASWQRVLLAPGPHSVAIRDYFGVMPCSPTPLSLVLDAGVTAYVANVVKTTQGIGTLYIGCTVVQRLPEQALKDMAGLRGAQ